MIIRLNMYFGIWAIFIPISSVVFDPTIKGTLPSYAFAFFSMVILLNYSDKYRTLYRRELFLFIFLVLFITACAQMGILLTHTTLGGLILIDPDDYKVVFRKTTITQLMYLFVAFITYLFVKFHYNKRFDNYIFRGGICLSLYGIYEVVYFLIFAQNGDFLSNRLFGEMQVGSGSLFQIIDLNGLSFQRLKSLTGEPSMFAMTIIPYWIYAVHNKKTVYQSIFLLTLFLSTSTTAILGIGIYLLMRWYYFGIRDAYLIKFIGLVGLICTLGYEFIYDLVTEMILKKVVLENISGIERSMAMKDHIHYFLDMPVFNQFFGIGFGYIRSMDLFTTLLVNVGIVGFFAFTIFFLYPVYKMDSDYRTIGLKIILIILYIIMMISVSEFSYLSTWIFVGIAYNQVLEKSAKNFIINGMT